MTETDIALLVQNNWWILLLILLWTLPWKGYALWTAARDDHRWWFAILLITNTLALLDIFYIFVIARRQAKNSLLETPKPA